jgi:hypothetical protein|tara:strand:- start:6662 stop:6970 length:309 start_codon:yes stop_codon:yes gene_type:complete
MDSITIVCESDIEKYIPIITRQTDYTEEVAKEKLIEHSGDHMKVIKEYMGITEKKEPPVKSVNQEIYRQMRFKLDASMSEYNQKQELSLALELSQGQDKKDA